MTLLSALVAATVFAQEPQIAAQRKVVLDNGASLYSERVEGAQAFTLHLFVSAMGEPEQEGQRGHRHLLEHLVAKGRAKDVDARLERMGLYLTADTLQDGLRFEIEGAPEHATDAIEALKELLEFSPPSEEELARELKVIGEETGVRTYASRMFGALNEAGYGSPDPLGTQADLAKANAESLRSLYRSLFVPGRISVAVVGEVDPTKVVEQLTSVLGALQGGDRPTRRQRTLVSHLKEGFVQDSNGSGRGVAVGSLSQPETLDVLAAAFAISSEVPGAQVMYSVSPIGGLVCVVHPSREGLAGVDDLIAGQSSRLYRTAVSSLRLWVSTAEKSTRERARFYGQMLSVEGFFRMEDVARRAEQVSQAGFVNALRKFDSRVAVRAGGVR